MIYWKKTLPFHMLRTSAQPTSNSLTAKDEERLVYRLFVRIFGNFVYIYIF